MIRACLLYLSVLILGSAAVAQPPAPPPGRQIFNAFSERFVGAWDCAISEYDEAGAIKWSAKQVRVFERGFLGAALEERAFEEPRLARGQHFGLHVLLFQRDGMKVVQYGIWPGGAARIFTVEAVLRNDGSGIDGTMLATDAAGAQDRRRVVIEWSGPDTHSYRVYMPRSGGGEYLREELVYRRRA